MNRNDYGILNLIGKHKLRRIFIAPDFILAACCAILYLLYVLFTRRIYICEFIDTLSKDLIIVSAGLFGILFAAFAIIIVLSDKKFMRFLMKMNILHKILLDFWLISILYIFSIILNFITRFFPQRLAKFYSSVPVLIFLWALFGTIFIINNTIGFAWRRANYLEYEKEIEEIEKEKSKSADGNKTRP